MMHVISRKWSSISLRDIQNENLISSSHLIGIDQLPNLNIRDNFVVELKALNTKIEANLKSGIELKQIGNMVNDLEIHSLFASVFSISILHVMLQPLQGMDKKVGDKYVKSVKIINYRI